MVVILAGPVGSGKTTWLAAAVSRWTGRGIGIDGFLSPAVTDERGAKGYDLLELKTGRRRPFLRQKGSTAGERVGPYAFDGRTLARARAIVRRSGPDDVLVVDELGPRELEGGGLWPALESVVQEPRRRVLLVVRESLVEDVAARLRPVRPAVLELGSEGLDRRLEALLLSKANKADEGQG